jgi:hypothetical protein
MNVVSGGGGGGLAGRAVYAGVAPDAIGAAGARIDDDGGTLMGPAGFGPRIAPAVSIVVCRDPPAGAVNAAPQCTQNRVPAWLSLPQIAQFIDYSFPFHGREACRKTTTPATCVRRLVARRSDGGATG